MSSLLARKQEEWNEKQLKELLLLPENKKCFDCPTKSPFFVNISIQTFVCARCSGLVREVGHRVKSISASKFSGPEVVALQHGGNEVAYSIWLSTFHSSTPEPETDSDVRMFMRQKYYEQKWLDRPKAIEHSEKVKKVVTDMFSEDGSRRNSLGGTRAQLSPTSTSFAPVPRQSLDSNRPSTFIPPPRQSLGNAVIPPPRQSLDTNRTPTLTFPPRQSFDSYRTPTLSSPPRQQNAELSRPKLAPTQSWEDDNTPIGLIPAVKSMTIKANNLLLDDDLLGDYSLSPQSLTKQAPLPSPKVVHSNPPVAIKSDIFSELEELNPIKPIKSPTYSGGILQPNLPTLTSPPMNKPIQQQQTNNKKSIDIDPYAALRDLSFGRQ